MGVSTMKDAYEYTNNNHPAKLLKAIEVAKILNISRAFAYQLMQRGEIRTVVIGTSRRVRPEDLTEFIAENLSPNIRQDFA
jgi:excisionase family DNA binding protein